MNLADERKKKGLTQKELAERSSISRGVIADIERGKTHGAPSTLARLGKALAEADQFVTVSPATGVSDAKLGAQVAEHRQLEGLTVAALAKLMRCRRVDVEALENGDPTFLDDAWAALDAFKGTQRGNIDFLGGGGVMCGFCGKVHAGLKCP